MASYSARRAISLSVSPLSEDGGVKGSPPPQTHGPLSWARVREKEFPQGSLRKKVGNQGQTFHDVGQFAHVAGPGVFAQQVAQLLVQRLSVQTRAGRAACALAQEVAGQIEDVVAPLAQRGNVERQDVAAIEKVLAEEPARRQA